MLGRAGGEHDRERRAEEEHSVLHDYAA